MTSEFAKYFESNYTSSVYPCNDPKLLMKYGGYLYTSESNVHKNTSSYQTVYELSIKLSESK